MVFFTRMRYPENMLPSLELKTGGWILLVGPSSLNGSLLQGLAHFMAPEAARPGLRVLDGGNRFNAYTVARAARGRPAALQRITVARAFTCHQLLALLESTPTGPGPFVILDLLRTFYDESVQAGERKRLLRACLGQLERLEQAAGGLVSVHPPALASPAALELLGLLQASAAATYFLQPPAGSAGRPAQMSLF
jgi:hypothetical protein